MRSDFFNQIHKNRERYYKEIMNCETEYCQPSRQDSEYASQILQLKLPRPSIFIAGMGKPDWNQFRRNTLKMIKNLKYIHHKIVKGIRRLILPLVLRYQNTEARLDQTLESWQESFYKRVIVLFDDQEVEEESIPDKPINRPWQIPDEKDEYRLPGYLRKLWTRILISLELDEVTTDIIVNSNSSLKNDNREMITIAQKSRWLIRKSGHFFKKTLRIVRRYFHSSPFYPMLNRFIQ
jgi:hypothetical protein